MKVGKMRYRITFETLVSTIDTAGFTTEEWITHQTVWADMVPATGKEFIAAAQTVAEVSTKIYIRYQKGLNPSMRIRYEERIFDIQSILPDERQGMITILSKEVT